MGIEYEVTNTSQGQDHLQQQVLQLTLVFLSYFLKNVFVYTIYSYLSFLSYYVMN